jgi:CHAT domain-containing protein/predicted Zn-dependent protease
LARDHLNLDEIECLAKGPRPGMDIQEHARVEEIRGHMAECEPCQWLVQMYEELQRRLGPLEATAPVPGCAAEAEWWRLAAGILPESEAEKLLEHATHCDACGLVLRQAKQAFLEQESEEELSYLTHLESAQPGWQQSLAKRLIATQSRRGVSGSITNLIGRARALADRFAWRTRSIPRYAWAYSAAAAVLLAAGGWFVQTRREPSIDHLIASAYAEQRPFELRIAGAAHGPVRQQRSGEGSAFAEPADLLRAKYLIKERLATRPNDQAMLVASGKVELLEGRFDEAIRTFLRLLDAQPDSPTVLTDLATAYFQRAEATNRAIDYGQTIELLGRALGKNPDDQVALFNRAIALQKMFVYQEAIHDWEHYLRVDPKSSWADEARRRLSELQEEMKARDRPLSLLQNDPVTAAPLLRARASALSSFPTPWPVSFDEEYLDLAVQRWLPSLYVSAGSAGQHVWRRQQSVWEALVAEADVLSTQHGDPWLAELLRDSPADRTQTITAQHFIKALDLLGQSAKANAAGDPDAARPLTESAAHYFRIAKSDAGYLRAREEQIYSLVLDMRVQDCLQASGTQLRETKLDSYPWLKGQAILWRATCENYAGNLDLAQLLSERALALTKNSHYIGQHLRSVLFASGFLRSTERNWQDTRAGLEAFWAVANNPFHAYEFYCELAILAEDAQKWHLALHLYREALGMIEKTPDHSYRAVAHYLLAVAEMRVQELPEAEAEFRIASQQLSLLPSKSVLRALSEIDLAAVEVQQGRLDSAADRLERAKPLLTHITDSWTTFTFYRTLGQLHLSRGNLKEAEQALRNALHVSELQLHSLGTEADRLAWERDAAPAYRMLVELYAREPDAARALEVWEWYRASALRGPSPSSVGADLSASLSAGRSSPLQVRVGRTIPTLQHETVISFAYLSSGVAAWAFDNRGVNFMWIAASREELAGRVRGFAHLCANPSSDVARLRLEGQILYNLLVAPFERHLEANRLLIVEPDSFLSDVPWPALVDGRGQYLGSQSAIVVSPGLSYWLNLRAATTISPEQTALVVGMPELASTVASRFSPLPDADREAWSIAARFRHSRLLTGREVTSSAIRQELAHSDVFHFAGHAVSGVKQSGLVLASSSESDEDADEPRLLSASDLQSAMLQQLHLVVLSACATAETEKGFGVPDTLVRSFLRAGVPHVVASRWPVDSRITEQTMAEFYRRLFEGLPIAVALQQAARTLQTQPGTAHPYYWAAFGAYGR